MNGKSIIYLPTGKGLVETPSFWIISFETITLSLPESGIYVVINEELIFTFLSVEEDSLLILILVVFVIILIYTFMKIS